MLESRYIPSKHITRVQAALQGQQKTEDGITAQGRDGTLLLLQSLGAVSVSLRCCISIGVLRSCTVSRGTFSLTEGPQHMNTCGSRSSV